MTESSKTVLKIKKLRPEAIIPDAANPGDAGIDVCACLRPVPYLMLGAGKRALVPTGLAMQIPEGFEIQVRPRSGIALHHGITVLNTPGTVDEGYRGEVGVILINHGEETFGIEHGMKIAQLCLKRVEAFDIEEADELSDTVRGEGGFGSTGS